jgi:hypothetical protein
VREKLGMKTSITFILVLLSALYTYARAQATPASWQRQEKSDPLHSLNYTQFTLEGKYLISPKKPDPVPPMLVVRCKEGDHRYGSGYVNGKFLAGYLAVDAVLDFQRERVPVEFKLDNGKLQQTNWASSTDGSGAFFSAIDLNTLLYGHFMPHKENTNPPVTEIIVGVPEYLGAEIEAEFDMSPPDDVAEACGVVIHKK